MKKVEKETNDIQLEEDVQVRKEKRRELSPVKLKLVREDLGPRLVKYKQQNALFGDRNSYSKTDTDAAFIRMKDDHMNNRQLKPGYNIQWQRKINSFFFIRYINAQLIRVVSRHIFRGTEEYIATIPEKTSSQTGYGSEENYLYSLEEFLTILF
ncbi:hypothetical protein ACQKL0_01675 [Peribacillus sp. NPDC097264]|uniref:hypothetical protein n=1 Tax=Peribacillus sp. NPDC097264 TaxID=3390616 RepID=UPI003D0731D7